MSNTDVGLKRIHRLRTKYGVPDRKIRSLVPMSLWISSS